MANLRSLVPTVELDILRGSDRGNDTTGLGDVYVVRSLEDAFARQPDLMVIASPSSMHLRPLLAAIDSGIPFYVEKPVLSRLEELTVLRDQVSRKVLPPNLVGCNLRFLPSLVKLKGLLEEGYLGNLVRADFEAGQWLPEWRPGQDYRAGYSASQAKGGGVLLDLIHEVDAAQWLLGDFEHVSGYATHASSLEIESDDCGGLILARAGGPIASVRVDYVSRRPVRRYTLVGDRGTATWDLRAATLILDDATGSKQISLPPSAFDVSATYLTAMQNLLTAIEAGSATQQPLE